MNDKVDGPSSLPSETVEEFRNEFVGKSHS